jgi:hypothetical protein
MKKIVSLALLSMAALFSCTEEVKPKPFTYSQILTGATKKTWKLDYFVTRKVGKEDTRENLAACEADDLYIFYNNSEKLFEVMNGPRICNGDGTGPDAEKLVSYTWAFNNANSSINMVVPHVFGYFLIPFIVKKIDTKSMELQIFINDEQTVSYVLFFVKTAEE